MTEAHIPTSPDEALALGRLLGQRRAFAAVSGRCSAAQAQLLRRIRDERLYLPAAPSWRAFCHAYLAISRRQADRLIALLNRCGPVYFELSQLLGISVQQFLAIQPAIHDDALVVDGAAISLIPDNAPKLLDALGRLLPHPARSRRPNPPPDSFPARVAHLARQGRAVANQLLALYHSAHSDRDRELILEAATELRLILLQPGLE